MNPVPREPLSGGMQYQLRIYFAGLQNVKPLLPVSFEELEQKACVVKDLRTGEQRSVAFDNLSEFSFI